MNLSLIITPAPSPSMIWGMTRFEAQHTALIISCNLIHVVLLFHYFTALAYIRASLICNCKCQKCLTIQFQVGQPPPEYPQWSMSVSRPSSTINQMLHTFTAHKNKPNPTVVLVRISSTFLFLCFATKYNPCKDSRLRIVLHSRFFP